MIKINKAAIYHRPGNQFSYSDFDNFINIQINTQRDDIKSIYLYYGDPNDFNGGEWSYRKLSLSLEGQSKLHAYWTTKVNTEHYRLRYYFELIDLDSNVFYYDEKGLHEEPSKNINSFFSFPYIHHIDTFSAPEWVKSTVWYQIFPDRFYNSKADNDDLQNWGKSPPTFTSFFGGNLNGIEQKLDYLAEMGINGIYLCPIFYSPSNHKYDTVDYFEIDQQFGSKQDLKNLIETCHKKGIKVMLDAVFNHTSEYFSPFIDLSKKQEHSIYKDWFHVIRYQSNSSKYFEYETFGYEKHMPKLNTSNSEVKEYLFSIAKYWVSDFDIDGWRLDVANEIDHSFWREFRNEVKNTKKDVYILGEVWHDAMPWLQGDQFDGVMNYPIYDLIIDFFVKNRINTEAFINGITDYLYKYPRNVLINNFNIIGSHDTARIMTLSKNNIGRVKLAYTFLFSFIGTPCIYYGDEIGMTGGNDPDCRACMEWSIEKQNATLLAFIKKIIAIRKQHVLFGNEGKFTFYNSPNDVIVYEKKNKINQLIFCLNNSSKKEKVIIPELAEKNTIDLFTNKNINLKENGMIELAPFETLCLKILDE